ncbi:MAG: prolyl oligopeptidase family serine peptidase [Nitrospirales bacterium]|nr:prolyl oligopeptidase family serine peptidase [Nitrospirales bacterium]
MGKPTIASYGSWTSPLTPDLIVSETTRLGQVTVDGDTLYWLEGRPTENGRNLLVRLTADGHSTDMTPFPFNVRTRVHEYGGGAYVVSRGIAYFSHFADQQLYCQQPGGAPQQLTYEDHCCYADAIVDHTHHRLIVIREDHRDSSQEPMNTIVSLPLQAYTDSAETSERVSSREPQVLVSGHDFYSSSRLNPDRTQLAWLAWNHPNMPWDGTELWVGTVTKEGDIVDARCVVGGQDESIFQPEWSPDGILHFISDRSGWWNLYRIEEETLHALCPMNAEFGQPQWVFGLTTYGFESASKIICTYTQHGKWYMGRLDVSTSRVEVFDLPYTDISSVHIQGRRVACVASSPSEATAIIRIDLATQEVEVIRQSADFSVDSKVLSLPQAIDYPTKDGQTAHAFFYKPQNADFLAPSGSRPPLMVKSHGGPTAAASSACNLMIQFWTSRGFAILDVNYGGSTGYGRAYRKRLDGQWGMTDVDDCVAGVQFLIDHGEVDPQRVTITGGSAGGYTTLCALTFRDCFTAGSSYYGVSDLEALVRDTHKFESRYLDRLVGPYPQAQSLYHQRSPIHYTEKLSCPVILFQGLDDKVVPPNQTEMMFQAVRRKGLPVAALTFEGEQHGFRRPDTIKRVLDAELYFYSKIFHFDLADPVEPIIIENMA